MTPFWVRRVGPGRLRQITYVLCYFAFQPNNTSMWAFGSVMYSCVMIIISAILLMETTFVGLARQVVSHVRGRSHVARALAACVFTGRMRSDAGASTCST